MRIRVKKTSENLTESWVLPAVLQSVHVDVHSIEELVGGVLNSYVAVSYVNILGASHRVLVVAALCRIIVGAVFQLRVEKHVNSELLRSLFESVLFDLSVLLKDNGGIAARLS